MWDAVGATLAVGARVRLDCGDGIKQEGEYYGDGNRIDGDGCSSSCRKIAVK